ACTAVDAVTAGAALGTAGYSALFDGKGSGAMLGAMTVVATDSPPSAAGIAVTFRPPPCQRRKATAPKTTAPMIKEAAKTMGAIETIGTAPAALGALTPKGRKELEPIACWLDARSR